MARIVWAEPALHDLDGIADHVALDDPEAAKRLVRKVFEKVDRLGEFPESGPRPRDLKGTPYRKLTVKPLLIYYRIESSNVYIVYVTRDEREFSLDRIRRHDR